AMLLQCLAVRLDHVQLELLMPALTDPLRLHLQLTVTHLELVEPLLAALRLAALLLHRLAHLGDPGLDLLELPLAQLAVRDQLLELAVGLLALLVRLSLGLVQLLDPSLVARELLLDDLVLTLDVG